MRKKTLGLLVIAATAVAAVTFLAAPDLQAHRDVRPVDRLDAPLKASVDVIHQMSDGFAAVASVVTPSVVTITSEGEVQPTSQELPQIFNDPMFRQFFGQHFQPRPQQRRGLGSGIIIRDDGYILTNNHVVRGADKITVVLDDESRHAAEVVGTDPRTDLAVLKIDATDLDAITLGDSDALKIGEWVLAIGSPFSENLNHTVTAGIVSAVGRSGMGLNAYEDFIQTDAAINPGNSGGALVNLEGELVGINTGIASRGGGSNGIGFSIPSNMAADVVDDLINNGKVQRGWLGVNIGNLDEEMAEAMDLPDTRGAVVQQVLPDTPAADAGLKQGDVVVSIDGSPLKNMRDLQLTIARKDPGTVVTLAVIRDGKKKKIQVELGQFPDDQTGTAQDLNEAHTGTLGLTVEPITPDLQKQFGIETSRGLVVTGVDPSSPAADKGIQSGDVILEINRKQVDSLKDFRKALKDAPDDKPVLFLVERGGRTFFLAVRPE